MPDELGLTGDVMMLDGLHVATLEPNLRFECSLRARLEEALARTSPGDGDDQPASLLNAEVRALRAGIQAAIGQLRANDPEAAGRILTEIVAGTARTPPAQAPLPWGQDNRRAARDPR